MPSCVQQLAEKQLINCPSFLPEAVQYEVLMGSEAYGVSSNDSDRDIYGFCIPDKRMIFPHLDGEILGFGTQKQRFEVWTQHHIEDKSRDKIYDFSIYSIVKYFQLVLNNNPNMIDSLFVPQRCILYSTPIGNYVREYRKLFLHKRSWHTFKGYAFQQRSKMNSKNLQGKRKISTEKYGYDPKFAYHIVRLLNEVEQILIEGDLDLERSREQLKSIRTAEWTLDQINSYFDQKERDLESIYISSKLPYKPDETRIKQILLDCLEMHFGNLNQIIYLENKAENILNQIRELIK